MDFYLAGTEIRLTYLQDRRALAAIDWTSIFDDLLDAGAAPNRCLWCDLDRFTHVILASNRETGRHAGILGLIERNSGPDSILLIDAAMVGSLDARVQLIPAMLAHALARVVCLDGKPAALAARRGEPAIGTALRVLSRHIAAARTYPTTEGNVIALGPASLARRIGNPDTVLDLRQATEAALLRDLRSMHRVRPERLKAPVRTKSAKSGGATRHPRKATRTGRIG